jgi:DNA-binding NarL/FixJ family response regulator
MKKIKIAVVDDHQLFRRGLIGLVKSLNDSIDVIFEAENGQDLIKQLENETPHLILLDISMPVMNGFETAKYLQKNYPDIKFLVLSMNEDEESLVKMLNFGAKGFVGKDIEPNELLLAISKILHGGFYYSDKMTEHLINSLQPKQKDDLIDALSDRELEFLKYACSEKTYREIADQMYVSPKTIEGYRDSVYSKLNIKSRVGLCMFAIKAGIINLEEEE